MAVNVEKKIPPAGQKRPGAPANNPVRKGNLTKKPVPAAAESGREDAGKQEEKKTGAGTVVAAIVIAVSILLVIFGTVFYYIMHNNFLGLGEKYRKQLKDIKLVRWVLPPKPDPEDPKNLGQDELISKYNELRQTRDALNKSLSDTNKQIQELQQKISEFQISQSSVEAVKLDADKKLAQAESLMKQLENEKAALEEKKIREQALDNDIKKLVTLYETMDAEKVAAIFREMGTSKLDMMVNILKKMKNGKAAEILGALDISLAGKITDRLFKENPGISNEN